LDFIVADHPFVHAAWDANQSSRRANGDAVIHSATFQSNTQHLVSNHKGIFAAFVKSRNEDYIARNWRLVRSDTSVGAMRCLPCDALFAVCGEIVD
jgi:hypothetical protein